MIWLASYPRSGNTFFRNILFDVYGISSNDYHLGFNKPIEKGYSTFPVVKTHLLPSQLPSQFSECKSIYLVRDGRDAAVSLAHHRKDIKKNGYGFRRNLLSVIRGIGNSFPGGWNEHVIAWINKADIVIKYEDLIIDPIGQVERLRAIMELPEANQNKIPTFESQKKGHVKYVIDKNKDDNNNQENASKFYRRGIKGSFRDEMSKIFQCFFWLKNRKAMNMFNYYDDTKELMK